MKTYLTGFLLGLLFVVYLTDDDADDAPTLDALDRRLTTLENAR